MSQLEVFHFVDGDTSFEAFGKSNGYHFWYALDLMKFLGYDNRPSFKKAINKAIGICTQLGIAIEENFTAVKTVVEEQTLEDYRLSRFACYLTTMFCDNKKEQVQKAIAYFAAIATQFKEAIENAENCERLAMREDITAQEKILSGVAKSSGVEHYQFFQNAGYRGLYNMNLAQLKIYKGMPDLRKPLLDFMGLEELAANLFRLTQTEAKLKKNNITGQRPSEAAAEEVGSVVRELC